MPKQKKGKAVAAPPRSNKRLYQALLALAVVGAVLSIFIFGGGDSSSGTEAGGMPTNKNDSAASNPALRNRLILPARPQRPRPVTLPPDSFPNPEVRQAYIAAKENPEVLETLACYCGCFGTAGHRNNLDCFKDSHGDT